MTEAILDWLKTNYPNLFIIVLLLGVLGVILVACVKITLFVVNYRQRLQKVEQDCSGISNLDVKISQLLTKVDKITTHLLTNDKELDPRIFQANSPIELSELGQRILRDIGGKQYVDDNLSILIDYMEQRDFKSGLDVQNYTEVLLAEESDKEAFTPIKNYIFQNPVYKIDEDKTITLHLNLCINIISIYLRNKYFEKYPDLKKDL